jgi:outer membrane protein OmpA-like peptidoglycan-associated protein
LKKKIVISLAVAITAASIMAGVWHLLSKDALLLRNPVIFHQNALITYVSGNCFFKESENLPWLDLQIGQKLKAGYVLKTSDDGEVDIRLSENTLMKLDINTTLTITENTLKDLSVQLDGGKLFARFHKLFADQHFQVNSGNTAAGIRGTDLVFESSEDKTVIYALSGITEVYNVKYENDKILLAFQKKTTVFNNAVPAQPVEMDVVEIHEMQQMINLIHSEKVFLISNNIQFEADKAVILPSSLPELDTVLEAMKSKSFHIEIAGHTANIGSSSAMYDLSILRAKAIKEYLVDKGISEKRLKIVGYGGSQPISENETEEGKARNRRVEFIIINE